MVFDDGHVESLDLADFDPNEPCILKERWSPTRDPLPADVVLPADCADPFASGSYTLPDADGDDIPDFYVDPNDYDPGVTYDTDHPDVADPCLPGETENCSDNCPDNPNSNQADADGNGTGDACESGSDPVDTDEDGIPDSSDNCPTTYNAGQGDDDSDDIGNACDNCRDTPNTDQTDVDANGVGDVCEDGGGGGSGSDDCTEDENYIAIDNIDADFSTTGTWYTIAGVAEIGFAGNLSHMTLTKSTATATATWQRTVSVKEHTVSTAWSGTAGYTDEAQYEIYDGNDLLDTVSVDQSQAPQADIDFQGTTFQTLGTYQIDSGLLKIKLTNATGTNSDRIEADAILIGSCEKTDDYTPPEESVTSGPDPCNPVPANDLPDEFNDMVTKGLNYLRDQQQPNGSFGSGYATGDAETAMALLAFVAHGHSAVSPGPYQETVCRAIAYMIATQREDGWWGSDTELGCCPEQPVTAYTNLICLWAMSEALIVGNKALDGDCAPQPYPCPYSYSNHLAAVDKSIEYCLSISGEYSPEGIPQEPDTYRRGTAELPTAPHGFTENEVRPHIELKPGGWHYNKGWVDWLGGDINHASFGTSAMVAAKNAGANVPGETMTMLKDFSASTSGTFRRTKVIGLVNLAIGQSMVSIGMGRYGTAARDCNAGRF